MKPKPTRTKGRKKTAATVTVHLPDATAAALNSYLDSLRPRPSVTAVVRVFVEDGLRARGFTPAPEDEAGGG